MDAQQLKKELEKLDEVLNMGFIFEEEYQRRKAELYAKAGLEAPPEEPKTQPTTSLPSFGVSPVNTLSFTTTSYSPPPSLSNSWNNSYNNTNDFVIDDTPSFTSNYYQPPKEEQEPTQPSYFTTSTSSYSPPSSLSNSWNQHNDYNDDEPQQQYQQQQQSTEPRGEEENTKAAYIMYGMNVDGIVIYIKDRRGLFQLEPIPAGTSLHTIQQRLSVSHPVLHRVQAPSSNCESATIYTKEEDRVPAGHYVLKQKYIRPFRTGCDMRITGKVLSWSPDVSGDTNEMEEMCQIGNYTHGYHLQRPEMPVSNHSYNWGYGQVPDDCRPDIDWRWLRSGKSRLEQTLGFRLQFNADVEMGESLGKHGYVNTFSRFKKWKEMVEEWKQDKQQLWREEDQRVARRESESRQEGVVTESYGSNANAEEAELMERMQKQFPWLPPNPHYYAGGLNSHDAQPMWRYFDPKDVDLANPPRCRFRMKKRQTPVTETEWQTEPVSQQTEEPWQTTPPPWESPEPWETPQPWPTAGMWS
ncbi:hypothetical protein QOT17_010273 [Balamuthia mandrillaris]